jgi:hypothetical protein
MSKTGYVEIASPLVTVARSSISVDPMMGYTLNILTFSVQFESTFFLKRDKRKNNVNANERETIVNRNDF